MRVIAIVALALIPSAGLAATIEVPSPGIDTIQEGIDAAVDGDLVLVAAGVYTGPGNKDLVFGGKTITLRGAEGPGTTIDCEAEGRAFWLSAQGSPTMESLVVTGAASSAVSGPSAARATLRSCVFRDNDGYAVVACPDVDVESCLIENNQGLGILVGTSRVADTIVRGNQGGGIFVTYGSSGFAEVVDTEITGNVAPLGAGISAESRLEPAVFRRCTVVANAAQYGGGLYLWDGASVVLENTILRFNCAEIDGPDAYIPSTDDLASLVFSCCAVDPAGIVLGSEGHDLQYAGPQVLSDPLLCAPLDCADAPSSTGRYGLRAGSPCLADNSPCGERIGAYDEDCDPASVSEIGVAHSGLAVSPNPVVSGCTLRLSGAGAGLAGGSGPSVGQADKVEVFSSDGRLLRTLSASEGAWFWDGKDEVGVPVTAGVYYARTTSASAKVVVVR